MNPSMNTNPTVQRSLIIQVAVGSYNDHSAGRSSVCHSCLLAIQFSVLDQYVLRPYLSHPFLDIVRAIALRMTGAF